MKKSILVATSEDGRTGVPISEILPYDDAKTRFKAALKSGVSPHPEYPVLEMWVPGGKRHRFKNQGIASVPEEIVETFDTSDELPNENEIQSNDIGLIASEPGAETPPAGEEIDPEITSDTESVPSTGSKKKSR